MKAGFWRRHQWLKWTLGISVCVLMLITVAVFILARRAEPLLRTQVVQALEDHFHAHVELDSFHVGLRSGLRAEGEGLRIWQPVETPENPGNEEPPAVGKPLIQIQEFRFRAPLKYDPHKPIRINVVQLKGLIIDVPPRQQLEENQRAAHTGGNPRKARSLVNFIVESLDCTNSRLTIETNKPGKLPKEFDIAHIKLTGIQPGRPIAFEAALTNPLPRGTIHTHGEVGPWDVPDPGETNLNGDYRLEHANLDDFKGIAGILSSAGHYQGTLRNITVDGETSTPDFQLDRFNTPVPLYTRFHAVVDGTNGDTLLDPVDAVLNHTRFQVRGQVVRVTAIQNGVLLGRGHDIQLTMRVEDGRMEDFMRLTSKSGVPLMTGTLDLNGKVQIPPGTGAIQDRLKLNGTFSLANVRFTNAKVQDRVRELSLRGQGDPKDAHRPDTSTGDNVRSTMRGEFRMANGTVTLPTLEYTIPGADVNLKGTYAVNGGAIDFEGTARMDATVSQMVGGWKGILLKPVDRYFKKNGAGTQVPIHIRGTRDDPDFGIDFSRLRSTSPQRPDEPH